MKKSLLGLVLLSILLIGVRVYAVTGLDTTPRIMYWWGKVNQHVDAQGVWQSDPDGTSGANIDKLAYCQKWYPNTTSVVSYQSETIDTWRRAIAYEQSGYTNTVVSDKCVQGQTSLDKTPRIAYWWGKVNQHIDSQGNWQTDPDGTSGANLDKLTYCKKWYPNTTSVSDYMNEMINGWREAGNTGGPYPLSVMTVKCVTDQVVYPPTNDPTPRIAMWYGKVNQHTDSKGNWITDPDGVSGAGTYQQWGSEGYGDRKLEYCQKFYPKTTSVEDYKTETITTWREKYNTGGPHTLTVMTTKCAQGVIDIKPSITVISPNGGESYVSGDKITIKWKTSNIKQNPDTLIAVMDDRTPGWQTLSLFGSSPALNYSKLISSNGSENVYEYSFITPPTFNSTLPAQYQNIYGGNHYKILVNVLIGGQAGTPTQQIIEDYSDNNFSINGAGIIPTVCVKNSNNSKFKVLSPNGGEVYKAGQKITVKWSCPNAPIDQHVGVTLEHLQKDGLTQAPADENGSPVTMLVNDVGGSVLASSGSADFTLPNFTKTIGSNYYRVVVYWWNTNTSTGENDMSDSYFKILTGGQKDNEIMETPFTPKRTLKIGSKGDDVKELQKKLGIKADGIYGKGTASKVKIWQKSKGITPDGVFSTISQEKLNSTN